MLPAIIKIVRHSSVCLSFSRPRSSRSSLIFRFLLGHLPFVTVPIQLPGKSRPEFIRVMIELHDSLLRQMRPRVDQSLSPVLLHSRLIYLRRCSFEMSNLAEAIVSRICCAYSLLNSLPSSFGISIFSSNNDINASRKSSMARCRGIRAE